MEKYQDVTRNAYRLLGQRAAREVIPRDPTCSGHWSCHDYPSPRTRWSVHPEYEVHLVQKGSGRFALGGYVGAFEAGHLVLVGSNVPHGWVSSLRAGEVVPERDVVFQFSPEWVDELELIAPELRDVQKLLADGHPGTQFTGATALRARQELLQIGTTQGVARLRHVVTLLQLLTDSPDHERRRLSDDLMPTVHGTQEAEVVNRAIEYIFNNLTGPVRLSVAAELAGMSESAFSKYFRRAAGTTFSAVVKRYRLELACRLLTLTAAPIATIAQEVGFNNLSNFNRQFRAAHGLPPSAYRAREVANRQSAELLPYRTEQ